MGNSNVLESHLNVHDNYLLKCYFCQLAGPVGQVVQVKTHILRHLSAIGPYKCNFCTDRFFRKRYLIIHENNKHDIVEDRYRCENCDFKTYSQTSYYMCIVRIDVLLKAQNFQTKGHTVQMNKNHENP